MRSTKSLIGIGILVIVLMTGCAAITPAVVTAVSGAVVAISDAIVAYEKTQEQESK